MPGHFVKVGLRAGAKMGAPFGLLLGGLRLPWWAAGLLGLVLYGARYFISTAHHFGDRGVAVFWLARTIPGFVTGAVVAILVAGLFDPRET